MSLGQIGCDSKSRMDALFGARYYDPQMSSWISTDPALGEYLPTGIQLFFPEKAFNAMKLKGSGGVFNSINMNTYQYASLNPIKYIDPNGRQSLPGAWFSGNIKQVMSHAGKHALKGAEAVLDFITYENPNVIGGTPPDLGIGRVAKTGIGLLRIVKTLVKKRAILKLVKAKAKHIFSPKHIKSGVMELGKNKKDIMNKITDVISKNKGKLKEGDNFIKTKMNGKDATIKAFVKDGEIQSVNAYKGIPTRTFGNIIE